MGSQVIWEHRERLRLQQLGGGTATKQVSVQQPEAKASQGGEEDKRQSRGGPRAGLLQLS